MSLVIRQRTRLQVICNPLYHLFLAVTRSSDEWSDRSSLIGQVGGYSRAVGLVSIHWAWNTFRKRVLTGISCCGVIVGGQRSAPAPICESYHQQTSFTTASGGGRLLGHFLVGRAMRLSTRTIDPPAGGSCADIGPDDLLCRSLHQGEKGRG